MNHDQEPTIGEGAFAIARVMENVAKAIHDGAAMIAEVSERQQGCCRREEQCDGCQD